jgi:hypothetical protein
LIGIEPEIVQCAEANGVCVGVLGKALTVPGHCARHLVWNPRIVAESCIADGSVVRETRMVRRGMKSDVTYVDSGPDRHAEGLHRAIEVLVVNGVLVMPHAGGWVRYFINDERTTIDTGLRLDQHAS